MELPQEFLSKQLLENEISPDPIKQFNTWFNEAIQAKVIEPTAMVLSTTGKNLKPSSRVVLLKKVTEKGFIFFTNYNSRKGEQIKENPFTSLLFLWKQIERQVRIEGQIEKISAEESDLYFNSRPELSRVSAIISDQSKVIPNREYLEQRIVHFNDTKQSITRPENWGGYILIPALIEFWQGRENRLHDRLQYTRQNDKWKIERLAP